jgi:hypothetical protein
MVRRLATGPVRVVLVLIVGAAVLGRGLGRLGSQRIGTRCLGELSLVVVLQRLGPVKQVEEERCSVGRGGAVAEGVGLGRGRGRGRRRERLTRFFNLLGAPHQGSEQARRIRGGRGRLMDARRELHLLLQLRELVLVALVLLLLVMVLLLLELLQQVMVMLLLLLGGSVVVNIVLVMLKLMLELGWLVVLLLSLRLRARSSRGAELEQVQEIRGTVGVGRHGTAIDGRRGRRGQIHDCNC